MKKIPLTRGLFATVDDDDYDALMKQKWRAVASNHTFYALGSTSRKDSPEYRQHALFMHRVVNKTPEGFYTDHINGDGLDNRKCNLRTCSPQENNRNRRAKKGSKSKFKGIVWRPKIKRWEAKAVIDKKYYYLGSFVNEIDAANAYNEFVRNNFGEFCYKNKGEDK